MYRIVVWATDGSEAAEAALPHALRLLEPGGRLYAVHCDQRFAAGRSGGLPVLVDDQERVERIRARIDQVRAEGVDARVTVVRTPRIAADEIATTAADLGAELIVCATRGAGPFSSLVLGSVTHRLLKVSTVPVLAVPPLAVVRAEQPAGQRLAVV
jgi:nucleotide-binding universal stress UspA family protein